MARRNPIRNSSIGAKKIDQTSILEEDVTDPVVDTTVEQDDAEQADEEEGEEVDVKDETGDEGSDKDSDNDSDSDSDSESESESESAATDESIFALLDASTKVQAESDKSQTLEEITESYSRLPKIDSSLGLGNESLTEKGLLKDGFYDFSKADDKDNKFSFRVIQDPHKVKIDKKKARENTAGDKWFGMKAPDMTPELELDMKLLRMRNVLDPKRFYKKSDSKKDPKYFEMGTIVEGNTEFFSARLTKKERKQTFAQELLGDTDAQKYFKRKYAEIGESSDVRRKKHFQNLKDLRKKRR